METARLADRGVGWRDTTQDSLDTEERKDTPNEERLEGLGMRLEYLQQYVASLEDQDLDGALEALNAISER